MYLTRKCFLSLSVAVLCLALTTALAADPLPVRDDPLVRMPGSQPPPEQEVDINEASNCLRCHADYNHAVEPGFNWQGSMMAQAGRDFLMWPAMTVTLQDSMWVLGGNPNAADICERCHFPGGWLAGRSDPTNASRMRADDLDGVTCDFCHRMIDPFFEDTFAGLREGSDWLNYWDETNLSDWPSSEAALVTHDQDALRLQSIALFNGDPFYGADQRPASPTYTENGGGQFFVSEAEERRAGFADSTGGHDRLYSRYHKSRYFCSTCHDVSNPVLANLTADPTQPLPSELNAAHSYFHVERTWSEFALSAYGQQGGAPGLGPFAPGVLETSYANDHVAKCQDCHMRDMTAAASWKKDALVRPDESIEHPESGMPLHDMTGGSAWIAWVLASAVPGSPNFDQLNHDLLWQGPASLTMDLSQGLGLNAPALLAGADRSWQQLEMAAAITDLSYDPSSGALGFRVQNQTGHKLISGYPEGRRMFLNIRGYAGGALVYEVNPYDPTVGTLKGIPEDEPLVPLAPWEVHLGHLVYEMKPSSTLTGEPATFHFALADGRFKDNRIPPKGFQIGEAASRLIVPVWDGADQPDYFTAAEYAGGYDEVSLSLPAGLESIEINLYYQTTSLEYISFLRDEINGQGELSLPAEAYVAQTDPFFAQLRAWGNTVWALWDHNKDVPGAAPFLMTQAGWQVPVDPLLPAPELLSATIAGRSVTLTWSAAHLVDPRITGYRLYYDQAGKAQLLAGTGLVTSLRIWQPRPHEEACYFVTSVYDGGKSLPSNILCTGAQP